jgi:ADP-ribosylglycohydrolase
MRTAPVALAFLEHDPNQLFRYAGDVSRLTHLDEDARDACGLWSVAIRHAVLTGELDVRQGVGYLHTSRRALWEQRLLVAESSSPRDFRNNGWVVEALQGAWSAIITTRTADAGEHVTAALKAAVRGGNDTDTVAAIAGALLGAAYGPDAVSPEWVRMLHGWPGMRGDDLMDLALRVATPRPRKPLQPPVTAGLWQRVFGGIPSRG